MDIITEKIYSDASKLAGIIQHRKQQGETVVFTNGCFDILHTGHTRYLQLARQAGDCLVIGVNSDESVMQLKGVKRPIVSLEERLEVLAALQCVDYVVPFNELDPYILIGILRPSMLVKGGDWPIEKIIGRDIVEGDGGTVFTVPEIKGQSTSSIIDRIIARYTQPEA